METDAIYPAAMLADARDWVAECVSNPEDVEDATDADVLAFVRKHYDGSLGAFRRDGRYDEGTE